MHLFVTLAEHLMVATSKSDTVILSI